MPARDCRWQSLAVGLAPYKSIKKWPRVSKLPLNHFLTLLHARKVVGYKACQLDSAAVWLHLADGLAPYKSIKKWPRVSKLPLNHFLMLLYAL